MGQYSNRFDLQGKCIEKRKHPHIKEEVKQNVSKVFNELALWAIFDNFICLL
jgi:hypothetical protein